MHDHIYFSSLRHKNSDIKDKTKMKIMTKRIKESKQTNKNNICIYIEIYMCTKFQKGRREKKSCGDRGQGVLAMGK